MHTEVSSLSASTEASESLDTEHRSDIPTLTSAKIKILIVDDSKTIRRTAENILAKEGYEVITAEDGFDALSKVVESRPDILLMDIMMPRLDGYQTCALIKNNHDYHHIPIIMLSSKDGLFDRAKGRVVGSDDYLTKPFSRDELLTVISRFFAGSKPTSD
ncbi:MAG: response regulator [Pseudomonadota bacterium]